MLTSRKQKQRRRCSLRDFDNIQGLLLYSWEILVLAPWRGQITLCSEVMTVYASMSECRTSMFKQKQRRRCSLRDFDNIQGLLLYSWQILVLALWRGQITLCSAAMKIHATMSECRTSMILMGNTTSRSVPYSVLLFPMSSHSNIG